MRPARCGAQRAGLLLLLLSFPSVVVGNLFLAVVVLLRNDRSPTKFLGDDDFIKKEVILNLVQDLPIVLLVASVVFYNPRCRFRNKFRMTFFITAQNVVFVVVVPSFILKGLFRFFFC